MGQVLHRVYSSSGDLGAKTRINNELVEVGGFLEGDRGGFGKI